MSARYKKLTAFALAFALMLSGCAAKAAPDEVAPSEEEVVSSAVSFPAFSARELEGEGLYTEAVFADARLTAVCLWTAECPYGAGQIASLERLGEKYAGEGFAAVALLLDAEGDKAKLDMAQIALTETGESILLLAAPAGFEAGVIMSGARVPCTVLVNGAGEVVAGPYIGQRDEAETDEIVMRLLAE